MMLPGPMAFTRTLCGASANAMHLRGHTPAAVPMQPLHKGRVPCAEQRGYSGLLKRTQQCFSKASHPHSSHNGDGNAPTAMQLHDNIDPF